MTADIIRPPLIELDEPSHVYRVNGVQVPSVTQILAAAKLADFSVIPEWRREFVLLRGQATHRAIHYFLESDLEERTIDPEVTPRLAALKKFLFYSGLRIRAGMIERRVYHPRHKFAGTYDVVAEFPAFNNRVGMLDWKNGDATMSATRYQLAAYLLCVPKVYQRAAITLKSDGNFRVTTYSVMDLRRDQATFLDALADLRKRGIVP